VSGRSMKANAVRLQLHALVDNLANFLRALALPDQVERWSLTSLREKVVKIGAKVVAHARWLDVECRHRSDHSMLRVEARPDASSEGRLTRAGHSFPEFSSARPNSGLVGSRDGRTFPKEGLVWSAIWGMPVY